MKVLKQKSAVLVALIASALTVSIVPAKAEAVDPDIIFINPSGQEVNRIETIGPDHYFLRTEDLTTGTQNVEITQDQYSQFVELGRPKKQTGSVNLRLPLLMPDDLYTW